MQAPKRFRPLFVGRLAWALLAAVLAGCDGSSSNLLTPTAPDVPTGTPPPPRPTAYIFVGDAIVVKSKGPDIACSWGEANTSAWWTAVIDGESISLEEEMDLTFFGTVQGRTFTASYAAGAGYQFSVCPIRESSISGTFSEGFESFEAMETILWGPPERQAMTVRRWTALRSR